MVERVLSLLSFQRNSRVKRLAFNITVNILGQDELRQIIIHQGKVDVIGRLVAILRNNSSDSQPNSDEEICTALHALANAARDKTLLLSFIQ